MPIRECITETYYTGEESIEDALEDIAYPRRHKTIESAIASDAKVFAEDPTIVANLKYYRVTITIEECPKP